MFCSEQITALYIVYKPEGGQMISAVNSQVLAKLHLGSERADIREDIRYKRFSASDLLLIALFYNLLNTEQI